MIILILILIAILIKVFGIKKLFKNYLKLLLFIIPIVVIINFGARYFSMEKSTKNEKMASYSDNQNLVKESEPLSYEEELNKYINDGFFKFDKLDNSTVFITSQIFCEMLTKGGYIDPNGPNHFCVGDCWDYVRHAYRVAKKFDDIDFIKYSMIGKSKDQYGYSIYQNRGSFEIDIEKEELRLYKTVNDLAISNKVFSVCRKAIYDENSEWQRQ